MTRTPAQGGERRFDFPAVRISVDEATAIIIGLRWVAERGEGEVAEAARNAIRLYFRHIPEIVRREIEDASLMAEPDTPIGAGEINLASIRRAIDEEGKLRLVYTDAEGSITRRIVCPLAIGQFRTSRALLAFCDMRNDFRHFRTDRIREVEPASGTFQRDALLAEWLRRQDSEEFTPEAIPAPPS